MRPSHLREEDGKHVEDHVKAQTTTTKAKADQGPPTANPTQGRARAERSPVTPSVSG